MKGAAAILIGMLLTPSATTAQSAEEIRFAKAWLNSLQQSSFDTNREYCGYLGRTADGRFAATRARKGKEDSCYVRWSSKIDIFASYHTHGGFDPDHYNEIPSTDDLRGDHADGVNGYIATPGGRFWFIDGERLTARQICSIGCLQQDPDFIAGVDGDIPMVLRYSDIERIESR